MKIHVRNRAKEDFVHDLAVFFLTEDHIQNDLMRHDLVTDGIASELDRQQLLESKHGAVFVTPTFGKMKPKLVAFIGLGKESELSIEKARLVGGIISQQAKAHKASVVAVYLDGLALITGYPESVAKALTEGLLLGDYEYKEYKSKLEPDDKNTVEIAEVALVTSKESSSKLSEEVNKAVIGAKAVCLARDLINRPPAQLHPKTLKEAAEGIANSSKGTITVKSYGRKELKEMGAGAILGVAQGSEFEPFLVHMEYKSKASKRSIAIVGKGVTFDSGGLSIKPSEAMEDMKMDMSGAATVIGVLAALGELGLNINVHGIFATVENMPSGEAMRVGDVLRTMSGKTVEVLNTDAEGRLILADALYYAETLKPDAIVDFATLTGACMVALGQQVAGLFTKDSALRHELLGQSHITGEKLCELPLTDEYDEELKSTIADMQNIGVSRYGGAITAALFLQRFIKSTPWAHVDIAGPAFCRKPCNAYTPAGGTGFGVRAVLHWLEKL